MDLQNKPALAKAVIKVMKAVVGVEKNLSVGAGNNSYKGVGDQDVKKAVGSAMEANGLCILPIGVEPTVRIDRWEAPGYNGGAAQQKQQVFTEVRTKYLLLHESGESIVLEGYGHGIDTQDKSAGKATTYALKYVLLYSFLVPTGKIDDADKEASHDREVPPQKTQHQPTQVEIDAALNSLLVSKTLKELQAVYKGLPALIQAIPDIIAIKDRQKTALS